MTTIRIIVAATDFSPGSDAAVQRAVQLARAHGASLRLLHTFDVGAWHSLKGVFAAQRFVTDPPPDVRVKQRLTELAQALAAQTGLKVEAHFSVGSADSAISAYVAGHETSLVVMGSRAQPEMPGLGSTALKVLRAPACPILIVRQAQGGPYQTLLCAIDLHAGSVRAATAAIALFPAARQHLVHAVHPAMEWALWLNHVAREQVPTLLQAMHAQALEKLDALARDLTRLAEHRVEAEVVHGVPALAIVERAASLGADCVAVGHHSQDALAGQLLGSMAQHLLHHSLSDVLVVP
ncbi:universal stress protein [Rhodoferax sp.]|uniref:universal stress protein n=1 Tax=Rhodoferax sp. TaxID=50421 RepID=UPI00274350ED|nr:universal stress protein [Rhodoferax sp.]